MNGYAQELKPYVAEEYVPRENISGVGTKSVTYLIPSGFDVKDKESLVSHLKQYEAIQSVLIDGKTITIETTQVISGNEINMIFDRLGTAFFQVAPKTK
ncbi:MAG TPA: hypothetical protein VL946_07255 [Lacibacter sp.]|nr:hypothetical protein [Lacibacter sp.]